jgi:hypothetical protein
MDSLDPSLAVRLLQQASKPPRTIPRLLSIDLPVEILLLIGNGIIYEGIATRPFLNEITVIREPRVIIDALDVNG